MESICLVTECGQYDDAATWSGTPYNLCSQFKSQNIRVWGFDIRHKIFLYRVLNRLFGRFLSFEERRNPFSAIIYSSVFEKEFRNLPRRPDMVMFIAGYYLLNRYSDDIIYAAYIDADILERLSYKRRKGKFYNKLALFLYKRNSRKSLRNLDYVFTQNEWTKNALIRNYDVTADKIINVGFGINVDLYNGEKDYNDNLLMILVRKGYEQDKGLPELLEAFKKLRDCCPTVKLAVVGSDMGENIEGVTCYYNKPRETTIELFKKSSLYILLNINEPNGISYLEALAYKTPIVGLNRYAFPEFSGNGKWGFILNDVDADNVANTLRLALSDKEKLKKMGIEGQKYVISRFNWDVVSRKMIDSVSKKK